MATQRVAVKVPPGMVAGQGIQFGAPGGGMFTATIPQGVQPGGTFLVEVAAAAPPMAQAQPMFAPAQPAGQSAAAAASFVPMGLPVDVTDAGSTAASVSVAEWYYLDADGAQYGPVSATSLEEYRAAGMIDAATCYVWKEGREAWVTIAELAELVALMAGQGGDATPAAHAAAAAAEELRAAEESKAAVELEAAAEAQAQAEAEAAAAVEAAAAADAAAAAQAESAAKAEAEAAEMARLRAEEEAQAAAQAHIWTLHIARRQWERHDALGIRRRWERPARAGPNRRWERHGARGVNLGEFQRVLVIRMVPTTLLGLLCTADLARHVAVDEQDDDGAQPANDCHEDHDRHLRVRRCRGGRRCGGRRRCSRCGIGGQRCERRRRGWRRRLWRLRRGHPRSDW